VGDRIDIGALFKPMENAPLVAFRIAFGVLLVIECVGAVTTGWVSHVFYAGAHTVTVIGFEWLQPPPENGMFIYYFVMAGFAAMVAAGAFYRLALAAFSGMWATVLLMQTTHYNNHHYLMLLLCLLLLACPANARASWDVRRNPSLRSRTCPRWCHLVFVVQIVIVYTYAGIAKLDAGWLAGAPIGIWFDSKTQMPVLGPLYAAEWFRALVTYGGLAFDLSIVWLLMWRRTRVAAAVATVAFHLFNAITFQVVIFAAMGVAFLLFFFPPEEVDRRLFRDRAPIAWPQTRVRPLVAVALGLYVLFQALMPLRHHLYEGRVSWTEEGHRMAWRMMLIAKAGSAFFDVQDPATGERWRINPHDHLSPTQAGEVATRPAACWKFVQRLKRDFASRGHPDVRIYVHTNTRLNRRRSQPLVDPTVDLAAAPWGWFSHADWIVPLR